MELDGCLLEQVVFVLFCFVCYFIYFFTNPEGKYVLTDDQSVFK